MKGARACVARTEERAEKRRRKWSRHVARNKPSTAVKAISKVDVPKAIR